MQDNPEQILGKKTEMLALLKFEVFCAYLTKESFAGGLELIPGAPEPCDAAKVALSRETLSFHHKHYEHEKR
jgi:hypothetical protein